MLPEKLTTEEIKTLVQAGVIPAGTPQAQIELFAITAHQYGLSPFKKQIYLTGYNTKDGPKYATIVAIDGFRSIAGRTGAHAGTDDARYDVQPDGKYYTAAQLKDQKRLPTTCTVTVYRVVAGQRCPFTHTCVFSEFYPKVAAGQGGFTKAAEMPFQMIAKCAEAFSLKKAFPELGGLSIEEEMPAFESATIDAMPEDVQDVTPAPEIDEEALRDKIDACWSITELQALFHADERHKGFKNLFSDRRTDLQRVMQPQTESA